MKRHLVHFDRLTIQSTIKTQVYNSLSSTLPSIHHSAVHFEIKIPFVPSNGNMLRKM